MAQHVDVEAERCQQAVEDPLVGKHTDGHHPDHDPGDRRGQEVGRTEETPAGDALVEQIRDEQRDQDGNGDRGKQQEVIAHDLPEGRVAEQSLVVADADPGRREPVPVLGPQRLERRLGRRRRSDGQAEEHELQDDDRQDEENPCPSLRGAQARGARSTPERGRAGPGEGRGLVQDLPAVAGRRREGRRRPAVT